MHKLKTIILTENVRLTFVGHSVGCDEVGGLLFTGMAVVGSADVGGP